MSTLKNLPEVENIKEKAAGSAALGGTPNRNRTYN